MSIKPWEHHVARPWESVQQWAAMSSVAEKVGRNELPRRGRGALRRWASDRDHYDRKPLVWYVSPAWRRASGR